MADANNLSGAQRAAIFLLGVGEEAATQVMRHMSPKEVQQVGEAMATIAKLTNCLLYTSPSPRDLSTSRMPSSA